MQLFAYDRDRSLLGVVERFTFLRWTRRYSESGDFELRAADDEQNRSLLRIGHILWKNDDGEAAIIEHLELSTVNSQLSTVLVRGRFATGVLHRRIVWSAERLRGDIAAAVGQLIANHLIAPIDDDRRLAGFAVDDTPVGVAVNTQATYRNLLDVVEGLCGTHDVGIKTAWCPDTRMFTFTLYKGIDSLAVFSREYENITLQERVESLLDYRNTALIGGEGEGEERYLAIVGGGSGYDRYEMFVDARDLISGEFGDEYDAALAERGRTKLAENPAVDSFDADINPHGNLTYKTDFDIGHRVMVVSKEWGVTLTTRITEITETYDEDGLSLQAVFGRGLLTLAQKLRG